MACIFYDKPCVFSDVPQRGVFVATMPGGCILILILLRDDL